MEELNNEQRSPYFTRTEELDFQGLCRLHRFKKREVVKDVEGNICHFNIYLPVISGSIEKCLSNVARYTKSHRKSEPVKIGRQELIKVSFTKKGKINK